MSASPFLDQPNYRYEDVQLGMKKGHKYIITPEVFACFLKAFEDRSPIHVDEAYAQECGFLGKVMHGAILNGFLSHFIGMYFPGRASLLLSSDLRFVQPSYLGDVIYLETVVAQKLDVHKVIVLDATFQNKTRDCLAARGRIQIKLRIES